MKTCQNLGFALNYLFKQLFRPNYIWSHLISLSVYEYFVKVQGIHENITKNEIIILVPF